MKDSRSNAEMKDNALKLVEETRLLVSELLRFAKADSNVRLDLSDFLIVERLNSTRSLIRSYDPEKMSTGVIQGYEQNIGTLKTQVEGLVVKAEKNHIPAVLAETNIAIAGIKDSETKKELRNQLLAHENLLTRNAEGTRRVTMKFENSLVRGVGELKNRADQIKSEELTKSQNNRRSSIMSNRQGGSKKRNLRDTLSNITIFSTKKNQDNTASQIPEAQTTIKDQKKETEQEREMRLDKELESMVTDIFEDESEEIQDSVKKTLAKGFANIADNIEISMDENFAAYLNEFMEPESAILESIEENSIQDELRKLDESVIEIDDFIEQMSSKEKITEPSTLESSAPEVQTPEASTSEPPAPEVQTLEASTPEPPAPKVQTPEASTPEASTPEAQTPEASTLEPSAPEAQTPEASTPESSAPEVQTLDASTPEASAPEAQTPEASTPEPLAPEVQATKASTPEASAPEVQTPRASTRESSTSAEPPLFEKAESAKQNAKKEIKAVDVVMSALRERLPKAADTIEKISTRFERVKEYVENFNVKQATKKTIESLLKVTDKLKSLKDAFVNIIKREDKNISVNTEPIIVEPKAPTTQAETQVQKTEERPLEVVNEDVPDKSNELEAMLDKYDAEEKIQDQAKSEAPSAAKSENLESKTASNMNRGSQIKAPPQKPDKVGAEAVKIEKNSEPSRPTSGPYNKATRPLPQIPGQQQNNMVKNLMRNSAQLRQSAKENTAPENSSTERQPERVSFKK